jgi:hypothetical protein
MTTDADTTPTPYEAAQIGEIAAWKSMLPSRISQAVDLLASPLTWVVGHVVPRSAVTRIVASMETVAAQADIPAEVARIAGVAGVPDLASRSLEECDRLACMFSARAERLALVEGTVFSLGGPFVHVPQQLIASLRSVTRIGHCYGYTLGRPQDRALVIDVLEIAMLPDPAERIAVVESLHAALDADGDSLGEAQDVLYHATRTMFAEEALDLVPVVGTAVSFLFDNQFMHAVDVTARRIFQERWLRDRGRVASIPPAAVASRSSSIGEVGLAIGQCLYCVGAVAGFTTTFPCRMVQHAVGRPGSPIAAGSRHGSDRAVRDAREFMDGLRSSYADVAQDMVTAAAPTAEM